MGTNCAPLLADIFLSYEADFIQKLINDKKKTQKLKTLISITGILMMLWQLIARTLLNSINIPQRSWDKGNSKNIFLCSFLDIYIKFAMNSKLSTRLYVKRGNFNVVIIKCPPLDSIYTNRSRVWSLYFTTRTLR